MKINLLTLSAITCTITSVSALIHNHLTIPKKVLETSLTPNHSFFEQYIDHEQPSLGTFSQYYIWSDRHYRGPGSPVVFTTTGEEVLSPSYYYLLSDYSIFGAFAKAIGAAVIVMEHRYLGQSSPFKNLTTKNLQYLTVKNAIADFNHFARTAKLPFDPKGGSTATKAPWIFGGGSYPGSLAAWTQSTASGTFWAYHASSAPVQAINDFWQYWHPIEENMQSDCYKSASLVIKHVDDVLSTGTEAEVKSLKKMFMLQDLDHAGDFAYALETPMAFWQEGTYVGESRQFLQQFCQWLKAGGRPGKQDKRVVSRTENTELEKALKGFSGWFKEEQLPNYCQQFSAHFKGKYNVQCFETYNPKSVMFTDTSVDNAFYRQYTWLTCNEPLGWWQTGGRHGRPPIVSKFLSINYLTRQCGLFFPEEDGYTFGRNKGKTVKQFNNLTGGWNSRPSKRLLYVNGRADPWREAGVSSSYRPGGPLKSTMQVPVYVDPKGVHCPDYFTQGIPQATRDVINAEVEQMKKWIAEYPHSHTEGA